MRNYAMVIGNPVRHSLSPMIYNTLYKKYNIPGKYEFRELTSDTLPDFIEFAKNNLDGFNITMPFKKEIIRYTEKTGLGSVNTVKIIDGKLHGYSTDEYGFIKSLGSFPLKGKNIVILGCGNVAGALYTELKKRKCNVLLSARNSSHVRSGMKSCAFLDQEALSKADILVNATPLGIAGGNEFENYDFLFCLRKSCLVYDLNYSPSESPLEKQAKKLGLESENGLDMLIYQAFGSFEIIYDITPDEIDFKTIKGLIAK